MIKRFLSLLCVLALCLGLLPVTALAVDAPATLYVGNQQVIHGNETTYWSTNNSEELKEVVEASDTSNNWNVKYDPNSATLTLKDATIETTHTKSGAVIYADSAVDSAVSLTINLEGTNKIECNTASYGIYVNAEMASDSYGTDASLTITGTGSLAVSGSTHGIWVKSGSGNASLTINNASVNANITSTDPYSAGVNVQSSTNASVSPNLSLAVNGGSLTASGGTSSDGIRFYVSNPDATNAITSLTVTDNAIVDAKNGGISALRILDPLPTPTPTGENSSGIVFDGTEGTVYGNVTLQKDLEIKSGETLTIPKGSTLNTNNNLTNNGTIVNTGGTLNGEPDGTGTVVDGSSSVSYLDKNGAGQSCNDYEVVTANDTQWTGGWYVARGDITIDKPVTVSGNVHMILEDGCNLTVNGGILLTQECNMYVYAQSTEKDTMGSLTANGTDAGIKEENFGTPTLTIAGGKITASGSDTGISAGSLTITDGYVSALGTNLYGNGNSIAAISVIISGGFVDLKGDFLGPLSTGSDGHAVISSTGEINYIASGCKGFFLIQNEGKIYGDTFTLTQDLNIAASNIRVTVGEGQTLTLDNGVTLTIP